MADITMSEVTDLADPKIKAIAKRVLRTLQLEAEKAVAHHAEPANFPLASDPDSAERLFLSRFNELDQTKRQAAVVKVMASVKAPTAERRLFYGDLAAVNLRLATTVEQQVRTLALPAELKFPVSHLSALTQLHGQILVLHPIAALPVNGGYPPGYHGQLGASDPKVRCADETNPEFAGDDEIALGGLTVDETGDTKKVSQFMVGNSFDDGEQKVYSPPKRFTYFNLNEGGTKFPKSYFVTLALAEKDMGGFADFLNKLWDKVKEKILPMITAAVGGAIGSVVPGLGTIVGAAVGWALGQLVAWLIGLFGDDVFKPFTVSVNIHPSAPAGRAARPTARRESSPTRDTAAYQLTFDLAPFA